jgi:hypothetical protein
VAIAAFLTAFLASTALAPGNLKFWLAIILIAAFTVVTAAKTKGGWRWRWGGKD